MPDQAKVAIHLGKRDRDLLLDERLSFFYPSTCQIIRETPPHQPIELSRSEWEYIQGCVAGEANHTEDERWERRLDRVFQKIEDGCYFAARWGLS
ncbi:MAG: hypothetical protein ABR915_19800 [Thermoguttaceae bacterium]|jgi:hypothetical protein